MHPIQFNVPVTADNWQSLARTMLDQHAALVASAALQLRCDQDGVTVHANRVSAWRCGDGAPVETTTLLVRTTFDVAVSRERAFALVGDPTRGAEWDPLDRGHEVVETYDRDHVVMRTLSKPPAPWGMRESLLFMASERPSADTAPWVLCARAVSHPGCPEGRLPRVLQQVYGWSAQPLGTATTRVTGLASVPEKLLPTWLLNVASVRGWLGLARKVRGMMQDER